MAVITVIGSLNVDMVTVTSRVPAAGETLKAKSFETGWGGKGANQAVAAARTSRKKAASSDSDIKVRMVGAVGNDVFGLQLLRSMADDGIDVSGVQTLDGQKTGVAVILVEESGENRILFTAGANFGLTPDMELVRQSDFGDVAVFQLETPMDVVMHNIKLAHDAGAAVILNPAPAQKLPDSLYHYLDWLIMNESETAILSDMPADAVTAFSDLDSITKKFFDKGVSNVIITLGAEGAYYQSAKAAGEGQAGRKMPATKATVVDTTAAGDTFVGAFAVKLAAHVNQGNKKSEASAIDAISFAIRAAGKTVQKPGAQSSIPWLDELE